MELETKEGEVYTIKWRHERVPETLSVNNLSGKSMYGGRTIAYIYDKNGDKIEAYANCSMQDCYNRKLGKKIAVGRLLKH